MRNALIISKKKEQAKALAQLLRPFRLNHIDLTDSAQETRRNIQQKDYNLVIINTPLNHEHGVDLALDISEREETEVILIVRNDDLPKVEEKLMHAPVFIVERPIDRTRLQRIITYLLNVQRKNENIIKQNTRLKQNIKSLKNQFRAKLLLMEHLDMSENEAHRYLQKQAMDSRRQPGEVAEAIIRLYEKK